MQFSEAGFCSLSTKTGIGSVLLGLGSELRWALLLPPGTALGALTPAALGCLRTADARKFVFTIQSPRGGELVSWPTVTDIGERATAPSSQQLRPGDALAPVWYLDSTGITIGLLPSCGDHSILARVSLASGAPQVMPLGRGFDVPQAWPPDGTYLAVLNYTGTSPANAGKVTLQFVGPMGQRTSEPVMADLEVIGWFPLASGSRSPP